MLLGSTRPRLSSRPGAAADANNPTTWRETTFARSSGLCTRRRALPKQQQGQKGGKAQMAARPEWRQNGACSTWAARPSWTTPRGSSSIRHASSGRLGRATRKLALPCSMPGQTPPHTHRSPSALYPLLPFDVSRPVSFLAVWSLSAALL
eukprot:354955-Chlamydomonas_euryale.AAC.7